LGGGGGVEAPQPVGVGDHRQRGQGHGQGSDDRAEQESEGGVEDSGGDRDAQGVVAEGESEVLADVAHGGAGQVDGGDQSGQVPRDQGDVGGLDRDVGAS